jgi:hypothetical protein
MSEARDAVAKARERARERARAAEKMKAGARVKEKVEARAARWAREATKKTASKQEEETMTENNDKVTMDNLSRWTTAIKDMAEMAGMEIDVDRVNTNYAEIVVSERQPKRSRVSSKVRGYFIFKGTGGDYMDVRFTTYCNSFGISLGFTEMTSRIPMGAVQNCMDEMEDRGMGPVKTISLRYKLKRQVKRVASRIETAMDIRQSR